MSQPVGDSGNAPGPVAPDATPAQPRGWSAPGARRTTLILVRHGVTDLTEAKKFSGGLGSSNPPLNDKGRAQVAATAQWLASLKSEISAIIASPVQRTQDTAAILAEHLELPVHLEPAFAEMEFGSWDGQSFLEVATQDQQGLGAWLGSVDVRPGGTGETFTEVRERVLEGLHRVLEEYDGHTVVVASHVTPIKTLVTHATGAPLTSVYRMELGPASVTVISFFRSGPEGDEASASLRVFNALPGAFELVL